MLIEVYDEVFLALELPCEFIGVHKSKRPFLGLDVIVGVHT